MKIFTKTQLSIALSLCVSAAVADSNEQASVSADQDLLTEHSIPVASQASVDTSSAEFLDSKFESAPSEEVSFTSEESFTPLDDLDTEEYLVEEEMAAGRRIFDLSAVAVTPEGKAYVSKTNAEDMEIFDNALEYISSSNEGISFGKALQDSHNDNEDIQITGSEESIESVDAFDTEGPIAESVLGIDERVRRYATTSFPFRTMGRIDIGCTGTMIGPRHVLTAGHCVYNINNDSWYSKLSFSPGQNGLHRPYGKIGWSKVIATKGWTKSHSKSYDYAMIVLKSRIGNSIGWLGYGNQSGSWSMNANVNGYPGDKSFGTLWHENCSVNTIWYNSRRVTHTCDTFGGMSGGSLYRNNNGSRIIYGVHAYGSGGGSTNSGTRITKDVFDTLTNWKSQNP
jgi:V8-like Glu-specific endopeptidase